MIKLPVCPHCHTVFRYGDVKRIMYKRNIECYHCGKKFKVSRIKLLLLLLMVAVIAAIIDAFELWVITSISFLTLLVTNIAVVIAGILIMPYFVRFCVIDK